MPSSGCEASQILRITPDHRQEGTKPFKIKGPNYYSGQKPACWNRILAIWPTQFQSKTAQNLEQALQELEQQNKNRCEDWCWTLRNNPGGVLNGAVDVADDFLKMAPSSRPRAWRRPDQSFRPRRAIY